MKSCPRCGKEYPDSEVFCEADGTQLVAGSPTGGRATSVMSDDPTGGKIQGEIECPVCGGKAQPGEVICNFCGTRLIPDSPQSTTQEPWSSRPTPALPENLAQSGGRPGPQEMGEEPPPEPTVAGQEQSTGHRFFSAISFLLAAIIALAAGVGLAIYLSSRHPAQQVARATPSASSSPSAANGPAVELAKTIPVGANGDLSSTNGRDPETLRRIFESNKPTLDDVYKRALDSDSSLAEGMVARLHIVPDGSVTSGSVRVSTSPNPSLDAEVIRAMSGWRFAPTGGDALDADYPIIFTTSASEIPNIESDLNRKLASLGPSEAPEYAFAPSTPSASLASAGSLTATPAGSPAAEVASAPSVVPPAVTPPKPPASEAPRHRPRPEELASTRKPEHMRRPPLTDRVTTEMRSNGKLRRVQNYTNGGAVTLFGKVFDDRDKLLAERTARSVEGVSAVVDNLTTDTQEWAQNQSRISRELQNAGLTGVTVKVIGRDAYLDGEVKTNLDRERAVTIAQAAAAVKVRVNLIRVAPGRVFGF